MTRTSGYFTILIASTLWLLTASPSKSEPITLDNAPYFVRMLFYSMVHNLPPVYARDATQMSIFSLPTANVNALATYIDGRPTIAISPGATTAMARLAFYMAARRTGHEVPFVFARSEIRLGLPPDWRRHFDDEAFAQAWLLSLRSSSAFVLGHELGHLCLGHIRSAFSKAGLSTMGLTPIDVRNLLRQDLELEADRFGIYAVGWNQLDYQSVIVFCRYMHAISPKVNWRIIDEHPNWKARERHLSLIIRSL